MSLFEKRETVFDQKDKTAWRTAKDTLKAAGIRILRAGSYETEPPVCGCGAKLDPRNFGPKGKIDRSRYYIDVSVKDADAARKVLEKADAENEN